MHRKVGYKQFLERLQNCTVKAREVNRMYRQGIKDGTWMGKTSGVLS